MTSRARPGDAVAVGDGDVAPWRAGLATGIGSLPGTDPMEAAALLAGELPDLPHAAELPDRGPGAGMIGRTLAVCLDMPGEIVPTGWRLARRPGRDSRRAADFLSWDLDAAEQHYAGAPWVKIQVAGPWTLAATVETPNGHLVLADAGARRDLAESLAAGLREHLAAWRKRLPGARFVIQVDEPSVPAVLAGSLPTASGFGRLAAVAAPEVQQVLAALVDSFEGQPAVVHCCHPAAPLGLMRAAGFDAVSVDLTGVVVRASTDERQESGAASSPARPGWPAARLDALGQLIEGGGVLLAGLVPTTEPAVPVDFRGVAAPLLETWQRLGLPAGRLAQVVVTPTCGLAGASASWTRRALSLSRDAAKLLADSSGS